MPGTATGTCRRKQRNVAVATSASEAWRVHSLPGMTTLGLSSIASSADTLFDEGVEHGMQDSAGDLVAALDRMRPVHQHFGFDDRHEVLFLT
jgi:hypothetical protein